MKCSEAPGGPGSPRPPSPQRAPATVAPHSQLPWSSLPPGHCCGRGRLARGQTHLPGLAGLLGRWRSGTVVGDCGACTLCPALAVASWLQGPAALGFSPHHHHCQVPRARVTSSPRSHCLTASLPCGPSLGPRSVRTPRPRPPRHSCAHGADVGPEGLLVSVPITCLLSGAAATYVSPWQTL